MPHVLREHEGGDVLEVSCDFALDAAVKRPKENLLVLSAGDEVLFVRREGETVHISFVSSVGAEKFSSFKVPKFASSIPGTTEDSRVVGKDLHAADTVGVPDKASHDFTGSKLPQQELVVVPSSNHVTITGCDGAATDVGFVALESLGLDRFVNV